MDLLKGAQWPIRSRHDQGVVPEPRPEPVRLASSESALHDPLPYRRSGRQGGFVDSEVAVEGLGEERRDGEASLVGGFFDGGRLVGGELDGDVAGVVESQPASADLAAREPALRALELGATFIGDRVERGGEGVEDDLRAGPHRVAPYGVQASAGFGREVDGQEPTMTLGCPGKPFPLPCLSLCPAPPDVARPSTP